LYDINGSDFNFTHNGEDRKSLGVMDWMEF